jgi:hypothetical protein
MHTSQDMHERAIKRERERERERESAREREREKERCSGDMTVLMTVVVA